MFLEGGQEFMERPINIEGNSYRQIELFPFRYGFFSLHL